MEMASPRAARTSPFRRLVAAATAPANRARVRSGSTSARWFSARTSRWALAIWSDWKRTKVGPLFVGTLLNTVIPWASSFWTTWPTTLPRSMLTAPLRSAESAPSVEPVNRATSCEWASVLAWTRISGTATTG